MKKSLSPRASKAAYQKLLELYFLLPLVLLLPLLASTLNLQKKSQRWLYELRDDAVDHVSPFLAL
jgi:hypothetical protein